VSDSSDNLPPIEPKSAELADLVEFARSDLPTDEQWAALTAQMSNVWGGESTAGFDQPEAPISHVSPAAKAGSGVKAASSASVALPGVAKVAGVAALAGALASGAWFASNTSVTRGPAAITTAVTVVEPSAASEPESAQSPALESWLQAADAPAPTTPNTATAVSASSKSTAPPSELRLLTRARDQLSKNPEQALASCRQHQRLYPNGQLAEEREVLLIEALSRLNRDREAGQRRTQFGKTFPDSAHQSRVKQGSEK
jgi:hypothetical protein